MENSGTNSAAIARTVLLAGMLAVSCAVAAEEPEEAPGGAELPFLDRGAADYRTPRAGEGFRTEIFGMSIDVPPRDRRSVSAWDLGMAAVAPGIRGSEVLPFATLFFWRHPDEKTLFRGIVAGLFNQLLLARSADAMRPFEGIATFENLTIPFDQAESIDGERIDREELLWGRLHLGIGAGYRRQLDSPGYDDNMLEISLLAEPGYVYFDEGSEAADDFIAPQDTLELRGRLRARIDKLERNLLELPHRGFAAGCDLVIGRRASWESWGRGGREDFRAEREYLAFSGHLLLAGGVPSIGGDRHRLIATLHGGTGDDLDRFSSFRIGGGPQGEEYESISRPVLPGAAIEEFATDRYAVLVGEYRWEPVFFTYLSLRSSLGYVNRLRLKGDRFEREDDLLASAGFRVTTGFVFETRLQLDYNFNAGVIRDGGYGGHEVMAHISGEF